MLVVRRRSDRYDVSVERKHRVYLEIPHGYITSTIDTLREISSQAFHNSG